MSLVAIALFWGAALMLLFAHLLVPAALRLVPARRSAPLPPGPASPSVSVIVSAYNEEAHIAAKIDDCLRLAAPGGRLEVIAVSDGSTDRTGAILQAIADPRLRVEVLPHRRGKTHAQNLAASQARHDVLFFTDATTLHPPDVLTHLLAGLLDPEVGCTSGRPVFKTDAGGVSRASETRLALELQAREGLGDLYSLLGAQDCVYAVPRRLYRPVRDDLDSGLVGPLLLLEHGHRTVYAPQALAFIDRPAPDLRSEFLRRSRIVLGGLRGLWALRRLLNPFRHPALAAALVLTRLLRWLTPVFLAILLAANLALLSRPLYRFTLVLQGLFYVAALAGLLLRRSAAARLFALPFYFCLLSAAAGAALWRMLQGETGQTWQTMRQDRSGPAGRNVPR